MHLPANDPTTLALWYHLNSRVWSNTDAYLNASPEVQHKAVWDPDPVSLRVRSDDKTSLVEAIESRQSCRRFTQIGMKLETLAKLLRSGYGAISLRYETGSWARWGRAVPSAGGLYPLEIYVATRQVEQLADAVYHYNPVEQQLERLQDCNPANVMKAILYPEFLEGANLLLILSAVFHRTMKKYGPRGYRYTLLEAGHCAQNICLLAAESGLGSLCLGGFDDKVMNRALDLNERREAVIYCLGVGYPAIG
jgi:SagB-type dehydrogenase family enzyme